MAGLEFTATITADFVDCSVWIPMEQDQPKNLQTVLVVAEKVDKPSFKYVTLAQYTNGYGMEVAEELEDGTFGEYDEDHDCYYCPKGFYQDCNLYQETRYQISEDEYKITHWMPLPKLPNHA